MAKAVAPKPNDPGGTGPEALSLDSWEQALHMVLQDVLEYILRSSQSKPADPKCWEAIGRLDALRRHLQRESGVEVTQLFDPHGRIPTAPSNGGE